MLQGLLPLHLNCPWRATASTAMVRSTMLSPTAAIGAVRLVAPSQATSSSSVPMPLYTPAIARTDSLCVALRIECV